MNKRDLWVLAWFWLYATAILIYILWSKQP
jgi:hypothetical protein